MALPPRDADSRTTPRWKSLYWKQSKPSPELLAWGCLRRRIWAVRYYEFLLFTAMVAPAETHNIHTPQTETIQQETQIRQVNKTPTTLGTHKQHTGNNSQATRHTIHKNTVPGNSSSGQHSHKAAKSFTSQDQQQNTNIYKPSSRVNGNMNQADNSCSSP